MTKQFLDWEKIFKVCVCVYLTKTLYSEYKKESYNLIKYTISNKKIGKRMEKILNKKYIRIPYIQIKIFTMLLVIREIRFKLKSSLPNLKIKNKQTKKPGDPIFGNVLKQLEP